MEEHILEYLSEVSTEDIEILKNDAIHMRLILELIAEMPTGKQQRVAAKAALVKTSKRWWRKR